MVDFPDPVGQCAITTLWLRNAARKLSFFFHIGSLTFGSSTGHSLVPAFCSRNFPSVDEGGLTATVAAAGLSDAGAGVDFTFTTGVTLGLGLGFVFGGSSDFGFAFGDDVRTDSIGSSSLSSDHCVLFFGTVSLGTTVALDGGCARGGDNTWGTEVVLGNGAVFTVAVLGDAALDAADFGDAAIGDVTAAPNPFGAAAFGDVALGDGTDLGADAAFGEDGGLGTDAAFGAGTDLQETLE